MKNVSYLYEKLGIGNQRRSKKAKLKKHGKTETYKYMEILEVNTIK